MTAARHPITQCTEEIVSIETAFDKLGGRSTAMELETVAVRCGSRIYGRVW